MNITTSNLVPVTAQPKAGQRVIQIAPGKWIPVGLGGKEPSAGGASQDLDAYVVQSNSGVLYARKLKFNGTQASDSQTVELLSDSSILIFNTGHPEPQNPVVPGTSMDFYKCTYVSSDSSMTWTGYKAVLSNGVYSFESAVTSGLSYGSAFSPEVGKVYADGALVKAELNTGEIPLDGLLCSALPDPSWTSGQTLWRWGDFAQTGNGKPETATISGTTGIKARNGDNMVCWTTAPTGDFTFLAKFYVGSTADDKLVLIGFNSWYGAIIGFESGVFFLSKQGVGAVTIPVNQGTLGVGIHSVAVTYAQSTGETKFYFDGVLTDTETYANADFDYSGEFRYPQEGTSDNLILGLAAYNRVLSAAEIAGINW